MFDAAAAEGEVAGVMAHELSHVLLRHGTANATKAENPWLQLGQMAGAIGGAVVGGAAGSAIAEGSQFGLGTLMLRYSRDFEKQADLLGAQIMARAGYDPRALAHMFETIEAEMKGSGASDPQWLSDHPNPGNRTEYITREATQLTIAGAADDSEFPTVKTTFASLGPVKSMGEPELQLAGQQQTVQLSNRVAIATPLANTSPLGGQERIALYTAFLANGSLFYYLTVAPEGDVAALQETFRHVGGSIRLTDVR